MAGWSRTLLGLASMCALSGAALAQTPVQTAQQVIDAIVKANGAAPVPNTVDTIKAGDPNTPVTGIVTTFMDTFDVLQKAVADGDNLIVTHEPTFYNHLDDKNLFPNDPVVAAKLKYIADHHLVVWRFHDGWHEHQPDGIVTGVLQQLGWESFHLKPEDVPAAAKEADPRAAHYLFRIPKTTVAQLAVMLQQKTGSQVVRVVGDPTLSFTDVAFLPGASGLDAQVKMLELGVVQVLVAGEVSEWETPEYVRDLTTAVKLGEAKPKALIVLGHEPSEEAGMRYCATWLKSVLPGMRIDFIAANSPFTAVYTGKN